MRRAGHIGLAIAGWRTRRGRDSGDLAAASGIDPDRLTRIEAGAERCVSTELFALARELGVSPGAVLDGPPRGGIAELEDPHVRAGIDLIDQLLSAERLVARYGL